jgi:hypothetical protein
MKKIIKTYFFDTLFLLGVVLITSSLSKECIGRGPFERCNTNQDIVLGVLLIAVVFDAFVRRIFLKRND